MMEREAEHLPTSSVEITNEWSFPFTFIVPLQCLVVSSGKTELILTHSLTRQK
jgi:hypothetical protein